MQIPTLEQEKNELKEITHILENKEKELAELQRIVNSLRVMQFTIQNSIKNREAMEKAKPSIEQHKEEINELKNG